MTDAVRPWSPEDRATLAQLYADGVTYLQMGVAFGRSRSAIASAVLRFINRPPCAPPPPAANVSRSLWSERNLTEPWAKFTARKKAERAAARLELAA